MKTVQKEKSDHGGKEWISVTHRAHAHGE